MTPEKLNPSQRGKLGAAARMVKMTSEERSAVARQAALARWARKDADAARIKAEVEAINGEALKRVLGTQEGEK